MDIDRYIAHLLKQHDCVIVPDFGGFVANYASAHINAVNHRFDPPYRKISFNKLLTHNDGLLAAYTAQKENVQYAEALSKVKDYTVYLKSELKGKKRVELDRIGVLFQMADGTFRFDQLKNAEMFREGFGLESFFSKPITRKVEVDPAPTSVVQPVIKPEPVVIPITIATEETQPKSTENARPKTHYWPAAAAFVGAAFVGYAFWLALGTPLFKDRSQFHASDLNPFGHRDSVIYQERTSESALETENSDITETPATSGYETVYKSPIRDKTLVVSLEEKLENTSVAKLRYHIIGGCFGEAANAERMVEKYRNRGSNAAVVDRKGELLRVAIASFATKKEAREALASFKGEITNAWILHK